MPVRVMVRNAMCSLIVLALVLAGQLNVRAEGEKESSENPLAPCERLIGGEWHMQETYQTFEWGVGKKSVVGKSYQVVDGEAQLVGEGMIIYHPGDDAIRGYFVGVGMGIDLWDYTSRWEGNKFISDLTTYGGYGGNFEEVWEFTADDEFQWTLYQVTPDGKTEMMNGTFTRK